MAKVNFYYANGTTYLFKDLATGFSYSVLNGQWTIGDVVLNPNTSQLTGTLIGQGGKLYPGLLGPENDPFATMLNADIWNGTKVAYAASMIAMGPSIDTGVEATIKLIQNTAPGQPFALGGYSQGAAVMSNVLKEIQNPSGRLYNRRGDFIGGVTFGNPMRRVDYRGPVGGTWSGRAEAPGTVSGGHGSFPATGKYARLNTELNGIENKWVDFAAPNEVITAVGGNDGDPNDKSPGASWSRANGILLSLTTPVGAGQLLTELAANAIGFNNEVYNSVGTFFGYAAETKYLVDVTGKVGQMAGGGHIIYPLWPPPNNDGSYTGLLASKWEDGVQYLGPAPGVRSCYQIALDWLDSKAAEWATAPVVLSSNYTGWSPTLVPPGT